jgi:hypothetical protein
MGVRHHRFDRRRSKRLIEPTNKGDAAFWEADSEAVRQASRKAQETVPAGLKLTELSTHRASRRDEMAPCGNRGARASSVWLLRAARSAPPSWRSMQT